MTRSESSIVPFLIPCRIVWLTLTARVPSSNVANTGERKIWTQSEFRTWQNSVRGQELQNCIYDVPGQETAKHRAKFGWPPLSDVAAVAKTRNPLKFAGVPKTRQTISAASGPKFTILWGHVEMLLFNMFFAIVDTSLTCEDIAWQICATVRRWRFFAGGDENLREYRCQPSFSLELIHWNFRVRRSSCVPSETAILSYPIRPPFCSSGRTNGG